MAPVSALNFNPDTVYFCYKFFNACALAPPAYNLFFFPPNYLNALPSPHAFFIIVSTFPPVYNAFYNPLSKLLSSGIYLSSSS